MLTCNLTLAVSRGNVIKSATHAAEPAVKSWTARPGVLFVMAALFPIEGRTLGWCVVVIINNLTVGWLRKVLMSFRSDQYIY